MFEVGGQYRRNM